MLKKLLSIAALSACFCSIKDVKTAEVSGLNFDIHGDKVFAVRKNDDLFGNNNTKLDNGYGFGASINYLMDNNIELGLDVDYRKNKQISKNPIDFGKAPAVALSNLEYKNKMISVMAKANYYFDLGTAVMPYIGVGVGGARVNVDFNAADIKFKAEDVVKKTKLAGSAEAGLTFAASSNVMFGFAGQYFTTADLKSSDINTDKFPADLASLSEDKIKTGEFSVKAFVKLFV